jgi:hypothetical protein
MRQPESWWALNVIIVLSTVPGVALALIGPTTTPLSYSTTFTDPSGTQQSVSFTGTASGTSLTGTLTGNGRAGTSDCDHRQRWLRVGQIVR